MILACYFALNNQGIKSEQADCGDEVQILSNRLGDILLSPASNCYRRAASFDTYSQRNSHTRLIG